jgi:hypothetical protein
MLVDTRLVGEALHYWIDYRTSSCTQRALVSARKPEGRVLEKRLEAEMGIEGGGATIYGRQQDGIWSFWQEASSIALDENDDEYCRSWEWRAVQDLSLALPDKWPKFFPIKIAPEFLDWF